MPESCFFSHKSEEPNPKSKINPKPEISIPNRRKSTVQCLIAPSDFGPLWDFDIRISDLRLRHATALTTTSSCYHHHPAKPAEMVASAWLEEGTVRRVDGAGPREGVPIPLSPANRERSHPLDFRADADPRAACSELRSVAWRSPICRRASAISNHAARH